MGRSLAKYQSVLISILLISVTFGIFWPVIKHEFVDYDDEEYVTENPHVTGGITLQSVVWAFTMPHFYMWHPLTSLSHLLDYELFGLNPSGHHLTSLLLHIANVLLLFWVLKWLTGAVWPSAFVAAIFGVHPLQTESVAWVAERKNVLSALFWMLTIAAYIRFTRQPSIGRYLLVVLTFSLGLMAKPVVVTLPCVLLLLDYWPLERLQSIIRPLGTAKDEWRRQSKGEDSPHTRSAKTSRRRFSLRRLLGEKIPLFILTAIVSAITYIVQQRGGVVKGLETIPVSYRVTNAVISYATYIEKMIWPSGLAVFYPHPGGGFSTVWLIASVVLLVVVSVCCVYFFHSRKYLTTGWLWYLGVLMPVIGLVQAGTQARADRYMYIPMVGLLIMVVWGAGDLFAKWRCRGVILVLSAVVLISAAMVCASLQLRHWQDSMTLYTHTLNVTRNNFFIRNNYANVLKDLGRVDEAIEHYNRCLQIRSDFPMAHNNLGVALAAKGRIDEAIRQYKKAIEVYSNYANAHYNLANALAKTGQLDEAIEHYTSCLQMDGDSPDVHNNLGSVLATKGRIDEAIVHHKKAIELAESQKSSEYSLSILADIHHNLAQEMRIQKRFQEALEHYEEALKLKPNNLNTLRGFGMALAELKRFDEAIKCYNKILELEPANVIAHGLLGSALAGQGKVDEAIEEFRIVLSRRPDDVQMYCNVGILLEQQGKIDEAISQYRLALAVNPAHDKARFLLDAALAKQIPGRQKNK